MAAFPIGFWRPDLGRDGRADGRDFMEGRGDHFRGANFRVSVERL
jgi:hypothetical protein